MSHALPTDAQLTGNVGVGSSDLLGSESFLGRCVSGEAAIKEFNTALNNLKARIVS